MPVTELASLAATHMRPSPSRIVGRPVSMSMIGICGNWARLPFICSQWQPHISMRMATICRRAVRSCCRVPEPFSLPFSLGKRERDAYLPPLPQRRPCAQRSRCAGSFYHGSQFISRPSPDAFDQRSPAERIVRDEQQNAKRSQVVWQSAIGTGIHGTDERGDCVSEIALVEIIEGSLLAPLDIFF